MIFILSKYLSFFFITTVSLNFSENMSDSFYLALVCLSWKKEDEEAVRGANKEKDLNYEPKTRNKKSCL